MPSFLQAIHTANGFIHPRRRKLIGRRGVRAGASASFSRPGKIRAPRQNFVRNHDEDMHRMKPLPHLA
uniref:Uncharacterized protein n=1 Tax=Oryza brachyantha TaxID=4533 RepID=J3KXS6_ORYBR